jgi:hypothetical protein
MKFAPEEKLYKPDYVNQSDDFDPHMRGIVMGLCGVLTVITCLMLYSPAPHIQRNGDIPSPVYSEVR